LLTPANSGNANASIGSPKMSLVFGPFNKTEFFINAGEGFHSNDARGVTIGIAIGRVSGRCLSISGQDARRRGWCPHEDRSRPR
jgi:hypothetical protein